MPNQPVQVVTNPDRIRQRRNKPAPVSVGRDFFAGNDSGFGRLQSRLIGQIEAIILQLDAPAYRSSFGGLGYVRVRMQARAIAKSHRPQEALFRARWTPHVATAGVGEPIFAGTPDMLREVLQRVAGAEVQVGTKVRPDTGEIVPNPTRARCEVSGIESIELWSEPDKRSFSATDGVEWLSQSGTGGRYEVELFPSGGISAPAEVVQAGVQAARALQRDLGSLSLDARSLKPFGISNARAVSIRVLGPRSRSRVELGLLEESQGTDLSPIGSAAGSLDVNEHAELLEVLGRNPLVRSISLPPVPVARAGSGEESTELPFSELPDVEAEASSIVGIIDGGVGDALEPWISERWELLAESDTDAQHGTFIAGLIVAGGALNPTILDPHRPGCRLVDINVLPADPAASGATFDRYFPGGIAEFLDEIEDAVGQMKQRHGVRVFNLSINFEGPGSNARYGSSARRLDEIARAQDVIFVISAGNLNASERRSEWGDDPGLTVAALARETDTMISEPAESLFNVSVSALNPPDMAHQLRYALTRYSRRGPGLRGATKPDLAHVGGSGTHDPQLGSGLRSLDEAGGTITNAGTSFAAPLVAREIADLDSSIAGDVPRETLLALTVHNSRVPRVLQRKPLGAIATDLAGFGMPSQTHQTLERPDSEIVMVISSVVMDKQEHSLVFPWPAALVDRGKCRGYARLTLVARPIIAYEHGDERIRVNIDAKLMQENKDGGFDNVLKPVYHPDAMVNPQTEKELLQEAHKWQVVKSFESAQMRGRGVSSNWKFLVEYLTRAEESLPINGVEFAAVLTISDPRGEAPVFQQMRQQLSAQGIVTTDIRTGIQTTVTATT
jgi:subtilisin family serine protease